MNINEMKNKKNKNFLFSIIFSKKHNTKKKFFHLMNINEIFCILNEIFKNFQIFLFLLIFSKIIK